MLKQQFLDAVGRWVGGEMADASKHFEANVITFHRVVGARIMGLKPDEAAIDAAMPKARAVFEELARLLGGQPYFAGDAPQLGFFTRRRSGRCWARRTQTSSLGWHGWKPGQACRPPPGSGCRKWHRRRERIRARNAGAADPSDRKGREMLHQ